MSVGDTSVVPDAVSGDFIAAVDQLLAATRSPAQTVDALVEAAGIVMGSFVKPEKFEEALATAKLQIEGAARKQLARCRPGVQRQ